MIRPRNVQPLPGESVPPSFADLFGGVDVEKDSLTDVDDDGKETDTDEETQKESVQAGYVDLSSDNPMSPNSPISASKRKRRPGVKASKARLQSEVKKLCLIALSNRCMWFLGILYLH